MVVTANNPVKTLTLHKNDCRHIPYGKLSPCGCGPTGIKGNQYWRCEEHIIKNAVNEFLNNRFWAILICDGCFGEGH